MAQDNEIVEDIERVELPGSGGDDVADEPEGDEPEGSEPDEEVVVPEQPKTTTEDDEEGGDSGEGAGKPAKEPKPVEGETPRERALRAQLGEARKKLRDQMGGELGIGNDAPAPTKKELPKEKAEVLTRYKAEEITALREVLPVLAEEMGYVNADQLKTQQYAEASQNVLDEFLQEHKEYLPENDKEGLLWNQFRKEFDQYKPPANPKEYRRIFNRIHTDIFNIRPVGDKGALTAAQRKINVASHAGASGPSRPTVSSRPRAGTEGLRTDMLKGFSQEELDEMNA